MHAVIDTCKTTQQRYHSRQQDINRHKVVYQSKSRLQREALMEGKMTEACQLKLKDE